MEQEQEQNIVVEPVVDKASEEAESCSVVVVEVPGIVDAEEQNMASVVGTCPAMVVQEAPCAGHKAAGSPG